MLIPDLALDHAFPLFGPKAIDAGLAAVFTFPLCHGDRRLGALDLYRDTSGPLDPEQVIAAQTLADVATAYLLNAQGRADLLSASARDRHESLHDKLTGLPNRAFLLARLSQAIRQSHRSHLTLAVLFIDLDLFKTVNDTHGHRTGDELLVAITRRLSALLRPGDTLGRLSGDEFVVICEDLHEPTRRTSGRPDQHRLRHPLRARRHRSHDPMQHRHRDLRAERRRPRTTPRCRRRSDVRRKAKRRGPQRLRRSRHPARRGRPARPAGTGSCGAAHNIPHREEVSARPPVLRTAAVMTGAPSSDLDGVSEDTVKSGAGAAPGPTET